MTYHSLEMNHYGMNTPFTDVTISLPPVWHEIQDSFLMWRICHPKRSKLHNAEFEFFLPGFIRFLRDINGLARLSKIFCLLVNNSTWIFFFFSENLLGVYRMTEIVITPIKKKKKKECINSLHDYLNYTPWCKSLKFVKTRYLI